MNTQLSHTNDRLRQQHSLDAIIKDKRYLLDCDTTNRRTQLKRELSMKFKANNFVTQCDRCFHDDYDIIEPIGEGAYGEVFVCRHKESGERRAVKILDISNKKQYDTALKEFNILRGIDHPNLLKIFHLYEDDEEAKCYIVSSFYKGGELFDEIEDWGHFQEEKAAILMNQLLSCINYLHSQNIAHRDLKPENILLADEDMRMDNVKVIDFGLSAKFDDYEKDRFTDQVGSAYYIAPEVLTGSYGPKCDIWSCGVITFVILCSEAPFYGESEQDVLEMVEKGEFSFDNPIWDEVSDEAMDFVEWLLSYDEKDRPTAKEALRHPWLTNMRRASSMELQERHSTVMMNSLSNLEDFSASSKLQQAVYAFISSQLIMTHEKEEIDDMFRALDSKCDGKLTRDELKIGFKHFLGRDLSDQELEDISARVNFSCSGAIEYSEFLVASMEQDQLLDESRLQAAFNEFDQDGSGVLTADDLSRALDWERGTDTAKREYTLNKLMEQIDTNQDGSISFEDFKKAMLSPLPRRVQNRVRNGRPKRQPAVRDDRSGRWSDSLEFLQRRKDDSEKTLEPRKSKSLGIDALLHNIVSRFSGSFGSRTSRSSIEFQADTNPAA